MNRAVWCAGVQWIALVMAVPVAAAPMDGGLLQFGWAMPAAAPAVRRAQLPLARESEPLAHATPLLDRLFPVDEGAGIIRRRSRTVPFGSADVSMEAMRQSSGGRNTPFPREKQLSFGLGSSWTWGADDLSLGVAVERMARAQPDLLTARPHMGGNSLAVGMSWTHDGRMRLDIGWRKDGASRALAGPERMVDVAYGAPLREAGPRLALTFQPAALHGASFGIQAQDAKVAKEDIPWLATSAPRDARVGFFARTHF